MPCPRRLHAIAEIDGCIAGKLVRKNEIGIIIVRERVVRERPESISEIALYRKEDPSGYTEPQKGRER